MNSVDKSKRLYVRGINKKTNKKTIEDYFIGCGSIIDVKFDDNNRKGYCWVEFLEQESADKALMLLHSSALNGTQIDIRYDHRMKRTNFTIERQIKLGKELNVHCVQCSVRAATDKDRAYYTSDGIVVNDVEYPLPTGKYLVKVLRLTHSSMKEATVDYETKSLLDILTESRHGNKHSKELTESIAMVDAIYRLGHLTSISWENIQNVNVYVVADGRTPYTMAALALFLPRQWHFVSIDPLLDFDSQLLGANQLRCHLVSSMSQDYSIIDYCAINNPLSSISHSVPSHNIVVACHSHAPLQEFWDRLSFPKSAVVMPCCGKDWSSLSLQPIDTYDDYEVYSPKRKIFLYHQEQA